jgi:hypothetical protein
MSRTVRWTLGMIGLSTCCWLFAAEPATHTEHAAHQHGHAKLNIALEGKTLLLELQVPAEDILGFEHAPQTSQERLKLKQAMALLQQSNQLVALDPAAECRPLPAQIEQHIDNKSSSHADILGRYAFECQSSAQLHRIEFLLFRQFPTLQDIDYQLITTSSQNAGELSPAHPQLLLQE